MAFALGARAIAAGSRVESFASLGSTNAEAMARARAGERGPLWIVTDRQTAGRGRRDRTWVSPPGNLAASILEVMDVAPAVAATLGFAAALALEEALQTLGVEARARGGAPLLQLKWPNDVLGEGKKLSGILLEAEPVPGGLAVVVGTGVNVVGAPEGTPVPAASLAALGLSVDAAEVFTALSDAWANWRATWDHGRGFPRLREAWLARAKGIGEPVAVRAGGSLIEGIFETMDEAGCLIVATADGRRVPVSAGDVYFGGAASAGAA
jgi:BirA family biotin operon repressor/biotin-[acetyl-CoA-carboxylase] ligase